MGDIEPIEDLDRRQEIKQLYKRLINNKDYLDFLFQPVFETCIMFHPIDYSDHLAKDQYEAIIEAAKLSGDTGFVMSSLYGDSARVTSPDFEYKGFPPTDDDWVEVDGETLSNPHWCEFPTYEDYRAAGFIAGLEHVLYSINGSWAVVCVWESHVLVGGSINFIRTVDQIYPQWRTGISKMIDIWSSRVVTREWLQVKLLIELLESWKRYPADQWVETITDKLNHKLDGRSEIRYSNGDRPQGASMGKIESIEDVDRRREIAKIGLSLFKSQNPYKMTFKPEVEACLMFHTVDADDPYYPNSPLDHLTRDQYQAIIAAAKLCGDTGFVLSDPHGSLMDDTDYWRREVAPGAAADTNWADLENHWWCEFPTYEDYLTIGPVGILDVALFSIHGHWGVFTTRAQHSLVGGNIDFISHVNKLYPAWRNEVIELIDNWEGQIKRDDPRVNLLIELLESWKRYPADQWVETIADKLSRKVEYRLPPFNVITPR